jgi:hypothetical protein
MRTTPQTMTTDHFHELSGLLFGGEECDSFEMLAVVFDETFAEGAFILGPAEGGVRDD